MREESFCNEKFSAETEDAGGLKAESDQMIKYGVVADSSPSPSPPSPGLLSHQQETEVRDEWVGARVLF